MATEVPVHYDLVVIGGGSGGLACSKEASLLGKKVAVLDYVSPSPQGSKWGLGGTCVNVGCIPKKLFHTAAIQGELVKNDARAFGWNLPEDGITHNWEKLRQAVSDHIGSLNFGYRVQLREKGVDYINAQGKMLDAKTIKCTTYHRKTGAVTSEKNITADKIVIAVGGRPTYPDIPGAKEYCISSDDMFSLQKAPGKTLVVGAAYVALECAGFLTHLGFDTTVMMRSIPLRGFDQQVAGKVVDYMSEHHTKFIKGFIPQKVEKLEDGKLKVTYCPTKGGEEKSDVFDTVLFAIGRYALTEAVGAADVGLKLDENSKKIIVNNAEETNVENVYAIGDVIQGIPELTPLAIHSGKLLARRLYAGATTLTDYKNIPTAVFTPLEYGCIGAAEEDAIKEYGEENIEVYHGSYKPLEWTVPYREDNACYCKLICLKKENERVIGFHYLGPNAGEVTQGYAVGIRMGATKEHFAQTIGIHPTTSEELIKLNITKASGEDPSVSGC